MSREGKQKFKVGKLPDRMVRKHLSQFVTLHLRSKESEESWESGPGRAESGYKDCKARKPPSLQRRQRTTIQLKKK